MSEFRFFAFSDFEYHTNRSQNLFSLPISPFHPTKRTTTDEISHELNVPYTVFEILVAICAIVGNLMVIIVFQRERKLRRRTNYYIVSLAMADFLVGSLGVPFAILASIGLPTNLFACLFTVSLLVVLCTISIFCLVAVSVDRYWAILYPMAYSRNVRTKTAIIIISMCWVAGTAVGFLPLFGWHADVGPNQACLFVEVMDYNYLVFLYFATIITPALLMLAFYAHIYRVIVKQVRQIVLMNPVGDASRRSSTTQINVSGPFRPCHGGTMLRVLGAARKRDVKATQNLSIIVLFFMTCWIPLYTINCIKAFCPDCYVHPKLTLFCIILSHLNSAVNPVLYAYHLKDFRTALKNLILRVMGVDVDQPIEHIHRYSMASQHRLQSLNASMRNSLQPRIYIDSPVWLRQQQQSLKNSPLTPKCGIVSPCLNNINQTVAAVASATTDIEREMWNITEASSGAEHGEISYEFPSRDVDSVAPTPPPRRHRAHKSQHQQQQEKYIPPTPKDGCDSPYSFENRNYDTSPEEADFDEVFLPARQQITGIDHNELKNSLTACAMRDKLRSDNTDYQVHKYSSENTFSDDEYELPKQTKSSNENNKKSRLFKVSPKHNSSRDCTEITQINANGMNGGIYLIEKDTSPLSPGHKPKFKKSKQPRKSSVVNKSRSCSCNSDTPTPTKETPSPAFSQNTNSNSNSYEEESISVDLRPPSSQNNNNNINATSNLNYYTFQTESQQNKTHQPNNSHSHQHQHHHQNQNQNQNHQQHQYNYHEGRFSPLRTMSEFFSPIVKHSSLFHIFDSNNTNAETAVMTSRQQTHAKKVSLSRKNSINDSVITTSVLSSENLRPIMDISLSKTSSLIIIPDTFRERLYCFCAYLSNSQTKLSRTTHYVYRNDQHHELS